MRQRLSHTRLRRLGPLGQAGDTLIEVLICILIVAVILTGAYVTTNKSSQGIRNSQEHAEALKLVQSQLEEVRQNVSKTSGSTVFITAPPFCMLNGAAVSTTISPGLVGCVQNSAGQPATAAPMYKLTVNRTSCTTVAANCELFVAKATWDSITNDGVSSEQISYRLYK
jgi:prepilin-type N-terminal cleavage/methylation domain-containing protein